LVKRIIKISSRRSLFEHLKLSIALQKRSVHIRVGGSQFDVHLLSSLDFVGPIGYWFNHGVSGWHGGTASKISCVVDVFNFSVECIIGPDDLHHPIRDSFVNVHLDLHSENIAPGINSGDHEISRCDFLGEKSAVGWVGWNGDGFSGRRWCNGFSAGR